jgi:hypothetical protein
MSTYWTKKRSANAVAAKERIKQERIAAIVNTPRPRKIKMPRSKARFRLRLDDFKIGDTLNLSLTELPWRGRFVSADGQALSAAQICRAISTALNTR